MVASRTGWSKDSAGTPNTSPATRGLDSFRPALCATNEFDNAFDNVFGNVFGNASDNALAQRDTSGYPDFLLPCLLDADPSNNLVLLGTRHSYSVIRSSKLRNLVHRGITASTIRAPKPHQDGLRHRSPADGHGHGDCDTKLISEQHGQRWRQPTAAIRGRVKSRPRLHHRKRRDSSERPGELR
ncbi:hypothetical protein CDEST_05447 [Colletotrichum destructivum]|uniref:Uncharacterized protein n=1 Tax=Colletotrichum destructivum TaxID=34406 RepID=A0AAX4IAP5_9PEZI|nr:hypothetical protein CDEST_05447 [Colletotrichum destructivum]